MLCRFAHSTVLTSQWTRCTAAPRDSFPAVRGAKTSAFYKIEYSMRSQSSHITCTVRLPTVFTYLQITEFRSMSQVSMINCLEGYISKQPFTCGCWDKDKDVFPIHKKKWVQNIFKWIPLFMIQITSSKNSNLNIHIQTQKHTPLHVHKAPWLSRQDRPQWLRLDAQCGDDPSFSSSLQQMKQQQQFGVLSLRFCFGILALKWIISNKGPQPINPEKNSCHCVGYDYDLWDNLYTQNFHLCLKTTIKQYKLI